MLAFPEGVAGDALGGTAPPGVAGVDAGATARGATTGPSATEITPLTLDKLHSFECTHML